MGTRFYKSIDHVLSVMAIPFVLFCAVASAALMTRSTPADFGSETSESVPASTVVQDSNTAYEDGPSQKAMPVVPMPKAMCGTCGVIESVREIEEADDANTSRIQPLSGSTGNSQISSGVVVLINADVASHRQTKSPGAKRYEITVRMKDGSARVLSESEAPSWRVGRKVVLIDGGGL